MDLEYEIGMEKAEIDYKKWEKESHGGASGRRGDGELINNQYLKESEDMKKEEKKGVI